MINFVAPITELTSYGLVGKYILKELVDRGLTPSVYPLGEFDDEPFIVEAVNRGEVLKDQPWLKLFHQNQLEGLPSSQLRIGFPIFELDRFNKQEQEQLKEVDVVFVCSQWAKDIVSQYVDSSQVYVVPLGVDFSNFSLSSYTDVLGPVRFLNIGKWEYRKGHDLLVEAFADAFSEHDYVELLMHCENIFIGEENRKWEQLYRNKLGDRVKFSYKKDYPCHKDLRKLYSKSRCFVSPTRAEGWGMPMLEAMACGLPVIATDITGQSEYISGENTLVIETDGTEVASDGRWFFPERTEGGRWAKLGENAKESLIAAMRRVYATIMAEGMLVNTDGIRTANKFTWNNTVNKMMFGLSY